MKEKEIQILIVDDNDSDVSLFSSYIERGDIHASISQVHKAEEAIHKLNTHTYDLCLIDVHLPGMGGIKFLRHILNHGDNLPTVVITDKGDDKAAINALKLGAYDYLRKDEISRALLNKTIYQAIKANAARKEKERLQEELTLYTGHLEEIVKERTEEIEYLSNYKDLILANLDLYVRVVDPYSKAIQYESGRLVADFGSHKGGHCYSFWKREKECKICTGKDAIEYAEVRTNEEFTDSKIYSVTSIPLKNLNGSMSVIEVIRDITDLKQIEAELNQKNRLAAMGEMSSHLGHEIRGPLHCLGLSYELLKESPDIAGEDREIVDSIGDSLEGLFTMANDLLDYSRKDQLNKEEVDICRLIEIVNSELGGKIAKNNIKLSFNSPSRQINLHIDKFKIHQVLVNVINNAIQAMTKGGNLGISLKEKDLKEKKKILSITITDSGCGINEENIEKIFVPFFTTKSTGTGLGMPIVKHFIELHGGELSIRTHEGKGTAVAISLPL